MVASAVAKAAPIQIRFPPLNGRNANRDRLADCSGENLSGSNLPGSFQSFRWRCPTAEHRIQFRMQLRLYLRMLRQQEPRPGHDHGGGLMPGHEHGDDVVAY